MRIFAEPIGLIDRSQLPDQVEDHRIQNYAANVSSWFWHHLIFIMLGSWLEVPHARDPFLAQWSSASLGHV